MDLDSHRLRLLWARIFWLVWLPNLLRYTGTGLRFDDHDTGTRLPAPIPPGFFTYPTAPLERYRYDRSRVDVSSLGDVHAFLHACTYDEERTDGAERNWMLPSNLEATRRGVCRDFAIWAWRQLADLDESPTLVIGRGRRPADHDPADDTPTAGHPWPIDHAWLHLERDGTTYLYETTGETAAPLLMTLEVAAHHGYRPCYGVDADLQTWVYRERWG
jgi:hypothetical protein